MITRRIEVMVALRHINRGDYALARQCLSRAVKGTKGAEFHLIMSTIKALKAKQAEANR